MVSLGENGYKGIDAYSKFWFLIAGIKSGALNSIKTKILASAPHRQEFDTSVTLYKDYIKQVQDTNDELNISDVGTEFSESSGKGTFDGEI